MLPYVLPYMPPYELPYAPPYELPSGRYGATVFVAVPVIVASSAEPVCRVLASPATAAGRGGTLGPAALAVAEAALVVVVEAAPATAAAVLPTAAPAAAPAPARSHGLGGDGFMVTVGRNGSTGARGLSTGATIQ